METIEIVKPKKPQLWLRLHYYWKFWGVSPELPHMLRNQGALLGTSLVSLVKESPRNRPKRKLENYFPRA